MEKLGQWILFFGIFLILLCAILTMFRLFDEPPVVLETPVIGGIFALAIGFVSAGSRINKKYKNKAEDCLKT